MTTRAANQDHHQRLGPGRDLRAGVPDPRAESTDAA